MSRKICTMLLVLGLITIIMTSCGSTWVVSANYEVCYPDGTQEFEKTTTITSTDEPFVVCYSFNGTNYISAVSSGYSHKEKNKVGSVFESTTAPMRLIKYSSKEKKNN